MAYFTQTDSLDDLRNQYKRLLTKFDYKDPKNAKLLAEIDKEYKKCQTYAKMAPLRKAKDDFARKLDEDEMARVQAERERAEYNAEIKRRTQRHYTKEDCQNYLNIACRELKNYAYLKVRYYMKSAGGASTCRNDLDTFRMNGNRKTYINLRTLGKLTNDRDLLKVIEAGNDVEIAFVALADKNNKERILQKLEEKLGAVYVAAYKEACDKYMDDVDYARLVARENKQNKAEKITKPMESALIMIIRVVASIVLGTIAFGVTFAILDMFLTFVCDASNIKLSGIILWGIVTIEVIVAVFVALAVIKVINKLISEDTYQGVSDKKVSYSRVTEGEKYDEIKKNENLSKNTSGVIRLVARLLGFRI
ncbi:hypothetical protein [Agathobacter sp.]